MRFAEVYLGVKLDTVGISPELVVDRPLVPFLVLHRKSKRTLP